MTSALSFSTRGLSRRHIKNKATSKKTIIPVVKYLNGAKVSTSFGLGLAKLSSLELVWVNYHSLLHVLVVFHTLTLYRYPLRHNLNFSLQWKQRALFFLLKLNLDLLAKLLRLLTLHLDQQYQQQGLGALLQVLS